jgi:hypothetical protein
MSRRTGSKCYHSAFGFFPLFAKSQQAVSAASISILARSAENFHKWKNLLQME